MHLQSHLISILPFLFSLSTATPTAASNTPVLLQHLEAYYTEWAGPQGDQIVQRWKDDLNDFTYSADFPKTNDYYYYVFKLHENTSKKANLKDLKTFASGTQSAINQLTINPYFPSQWSYAPSDSKSPVNGWNVSFTLFRPESGKHDMAATKEEPLLLMQGFMDYLNKPRAVNYGAFDLLLQFDNGSTVAYAYLDKTGGKKA